MHQYVSMAIRKIVLKPDRISKHCRMSSLCMYVCMCVCVCMFVSARMYVKYIYKQELIAEFVGFSSSRMCVSVVSNSLCMCRHVYVRVKIVVIQHVAFSHHLHVCIHIYIHICMCGIVGFLVNCTSILSIVVRGLFNFL